MNSVLAVSVADPSSAGTGLGGWYAGLVIGFVVVVVVVVIVAAILALASRIVVQAADAVDALDRAQANTLPLWEVEDVTRSASAILTSARIARETLEG